MNDRAVSVLSEYEFEVLRTWKGRGAILFETEEGIRILKEYTGFVEKLAVQQALLAHIREYTDIPVEEIVPNKEGQLYVTDQGQNTYIVKTYFEGQECNIKDEKECKEAVRRLALLHKGMIIRDKESLMPLSMPEIGKEYDKHNREIKKIRKFLRNKSQKNDFEIYLLKYYDCFMEKAFSVLQEWKNSQVFIPESDCITWCHGDYQHHNLLFYNNDMNVINFEKCVCDSQVRDLYLFLRKLLEKNNWSLSVGNSLLEAYEKEKTLNSSERKQLYYRLAYPEKFWKIVNFYYNSGKAWIPGKNMEKFDKLLKQEKEKELFLRQIMRG